jgi:hypothetical protein
LPGGGDDLGPACRVQARQARGEGFAQRRRRALDHGLADLRQPCVHHPPVMAGAVALDDSPILQIVEHGDHGGQRDVGIGRQRGAGHLAQFGDALHDDELGRCQAARLDQRLGIDVMRAHHPAHGLFQGFEVLGGELPA